MAATGQLRAFLALALLGGPAAALAFDEATERACDEGDRQACHRVGLAALGADGGLKDRARAWSRLQRACELGEAPACDDGAAWARSRANPEGQRWFEEHGQRARECESGDATACTLAAEVARSEGNGEAARRFEARALDGPGEWASFGVDAGAPDASVETPPPLTPSGVEGPSPSEPAPLTPSGVEGATPVTPSAAEQAWRAEAPEADAGTPPLASARAEPRPSLNNRCIEDAQYARYRSVMATRDDPKAFRPSAIWAPPIFMTDAERSYAWAGLLYFQSFDFEQGTRLRLLAPFFASHCSKDAETFISPLYSSRTDAEGTARLIFTYFQRRDRLAETDVFFPLAWSVRERETEDSPWSGHGAVLPLAFWKRALTGEHFTVVAPLFWRWGDKDETTTVAGNVFLHESPTRTDFGIVPLYFRGRGTEGDYDVMPLLFWSNRNGAKHSLLLPPLLTYHEGDGQTESTWVLNTYFQSRPKGFTLNVFPLLFSGREGDEHHTYVPPLFWRWGNAQESTTVVANTYFHEDPTGSDFGFVPLYFAGRGAASDYDVMPLLFWSYRHGPRHSLFLPPLFTWFQSRPNGFTLNVVPLLFAGREGDEHHTYVPPFFWRWGKQDETTTIVANVFLHETPTRSDFGVVPFYFGGRSVDGDSDVSPLLFWSYRKGAKHSLFIPPLLTYHQGDGETESTWVLNAYFQSRPDGFTFNVAPLLFAGRQGAEHHTFVPPLFWRWGDKDSSTTIAANVFFSETPERTDFGIVPLYFRGRSAAAQYDVSPLLFWSFREGKKHSLFLPPLLAFHEGDGETESTWALTAYFQSRPNGFTFNVAPLLFAGRQGDAHHTFVPPLFWRWGDKFETTTIAANVFLHESRTRSDFGIVPLYFRGRSSEGDYDVSPLLFWSFRAGAQHSLFIPPLLAYHQGDGVTESTWVLTAYFQSRPNGFTFNVAPFLFAGRQGDEHHTFVPPLFWRWGDKDSSTTIAANVFFSETPERTDFGIVPLYFRGRSAAAQYDVSPLLFWSFREGKKHSLFLPPLLAFHEGDGETESTWALTAYFQSRPNGFTFNVAPLLFAGREGDEHHTFVPPLFWRWGNKEHSTTIAANVFFSETTDRTDFGIVPLYFRGRSAEAGYDVSPPLFWSFRSGAGHSLLIPPLLTFHHGDGVTESTWAINTWFQSRPGGFTLASVPFLFAGREGDAHHTVVPPLFWRWGDKDSSTTIAANVFFSETPERTDFGIVPLYFRGRSAEAAYDVSPPLFWSFREGKKHSLLLPPLLTFHQGDGETESTWAVNTWFQSRPGGFTLASVPFLFVGREGDAHHTVVPPLFWRWGDKDGSTTIVLNGYFSESTAGSAFGFVPLYFGGRSKTGDYDVSPLLFWSFREEGKHSLLIPPLFTYHRGDGDTETTWAFNTYYQTRPNGFTLNVAPFVFAGRDGESHHTFVPPFFERWGDPVETTTVVGTAFLHETTTQDDFGVVPLYFGGRGLKGDYDVSPLLFWSFRDEAKHSLFLPPLLTWFQSRPTGFTLASVPFLFAGREGDKHHTVVPPLFWRWGDKGESTTIAANVFFHESPTRWDFGIAPLYFGGRGPGTAYDVAPPLFWSFREEGKHSLFIPPLLTWFQSRPSGFSLASVPFLFVGREGDEHHTVVPPLFWRWGDKDQTTTIVGPAFHHGEASGSVFGLAPLYFGGRGAEKSWDLIPPLLFYRSATATSRHVMALPFFDYTETGDTSLLVSPLAVYSKGPGFERTVVGGLYWHWAGPDIDARVVAPLFWDFKSKSAGTRLTTFFPIYWRYEKPEEVTQLVLNVMWSYGQTKLGKSWGFHFFPFVDLVSYHPEHFLWQVFLGLLGRETLADSARWRVGWVWTEPTKRL